MMADREGEELPGQWRRRATQGNFQIWRPKTFGSCIHIPYTHLAIFMAKHSRKRQRTDGSVQEAARPLGTQISLTDDASKDDEERKLESLLFGVPFVPSTKKNADALPGSDSEKDAVENVAGGAELKNLLDTDVRYNVIQ